MPKVWNNLSEGIVIAKCVHKVMERLDKYRKGDGTVGD